MRALLKRAAPSKAVESACLKGDNSTSQDSSAELPTLSQSPVVNPGVSTNNVRVNEEACDTTTGPDDHDHDLDRIPPEEIEGIRRRAHLYYIENVLGKQEKLERTFGKSEVRARQRQVVSRERNGVNEAERVGDEGDEREDDDDDEDEDEDVDDAAADDDRGVDDAANCEYGRCRRESEAVLDSGHDEEERAVVGDEDSEDEEEEEGRSVFHTANPRLRRGFRTRAKKAQGHGSWAAPEMPGMMGTTGMTGMTDRQGTEKGRRKDSERQKGTFDQTARKEGEKPEYLQRRRVAGETATIVSQNHVLSTATVEEGDDNAELKFSVRLMQEVSEVYSPPVVSMESGNTEAYVDPMRAPWGLLKIAKTHGVELSSMRRKTTIAILGNVSAGKSTFINWFVGEKLQRTGVAIETATFTYITSGRVIRELSGAAAHTMLPHLHPLMEKHPVLKSHLTLKTCPNHSDRLAMIDLIDTPGLVDSGADAEYPFNLSQIILDLNEVVDLYLVFFDPHSQASKRALSLLTKQLYQQCPEKLRFCLAKLDSVPSERDRLKVMSQLASNLAAATANPLLEVIPFFIRGAKDGTFLYHKAASVLRLREKENKNTQLRNANRIDDVVEAMYTSVRLRLQNVIASACSDVGLLQDHLQRRMMDLEEAQQRGLRESKIRWFLSFVQLTLMLTLPQVVAVQLSALDVVELRGLVYGYGDHLTLIGDALAQVPYGLCAMWIFWFLTCFYVRTTKRGLTQAPVSAQELAIVKADLAMLENYAHRTAELRRLFYQYSLEEHTDFE